MSMLWNDGSVAVRQFRRRPGFALAVLATMALSAGATSLCFR